MIEWLDRGRGPTGLEIFLAVLLLAWGGVVLQFACARWLL